MAAAPPRIGPSPPPSAIRATWARSTRSTGPGRVNSTLRAGSPRNTASAAASKSGLRNAAAKSRGSARGAMNSAAAALVRTMRRWRSIRISGSGTAAMIASAAASRASIAPDMFAPGAIEAQRSRVCMARAARLSRVARSNRDRCIRTECCSSLRAPPTPAKRSVIAVIPSGTTPSRATAGEDLPARRRARRFR